MGSFAITAYVFEQDATIDPSLLAWLPTSACSDRSQTVSRDRVKSYENAALQGVHEQTSATVCTLHVHTESRNSARVRGDYLLIRYIAHMVGDRQCCQRYSKYTNTKRNYR